MAQEVERKFLVRDTSILDSYISREEITQGYPLAGAHYVVRIRVTSEGGSLNVKSRKVAPVRDEIQAELPIAMAMDLMMAAPSVIRKTRYSVVAGGLPWSIDEFHDANEGLVVAEAELTMGQSHEKLELPVWCAREVTHDKRYYNEYLALNSYGSWPDIERRDAT